MCREPIEMQDSSYCASSCIVIDVNVQGIDRLVLCGNKVLQQLTNATFLCAPEKSLRKKSRKAQFIRHAAAVPNEIGRIKFGSNTVAARRMNRA